MATQTTKGKEQQSQSSQGQEMTRGSQPQGGLFRRSGYGLAMPLAPAEFFRMNPFSVMRRMSEELDRMFGEWNSRESRERVWEPAIEAMEHDGHYMVRAELPGLNPSDVKVEIADDAIVVQGERKMEHQEEKGGVRVSERRYGKFYREIPLPEGAKAEEARAKFENGVLEVSVPVEEQASKRRAIPIEGGSSGTAATSSEKPRASAGSPGGSEKAA